MKEKVKMQGTVIDVKRQLIGYEPIFGEEIDINVDGFIVKVKQREDKANPTKVGDEVNVIVTENVETFGEKKIPFFKTITKKESPDATVEIKFGRPNKYIIKAGNYKKEMNGIELLDLIACISSSQSNTLRSLLRKSKK